jgi:hypothetical protein
MISHFTRIKPTHDGFALEVDADTAQLIADALDIVNCFDPATQEWARVCAFNISTAVERFPPPRTPKENDHGLSAAA